MLNNRTPFSVGDIQKFIRDEADPNFAGTQYVHQFSENYKDLQKRLLALEESSRITVDEILSHPWVQRIRNQEKKQQQLIL